MRLRFSLILVIVATIGVPRAGEAQQSTANAKVMVTDDRFGKRVAPITLLSRTDVITELGLTAEQRTAAETAVQRFHDEGLKLVGKKGPEVEAARGQIDADQTGWLREHLSQDQRIRLLQIDLQWEGPSALVSRPMVSNAIGLSPSQSEIIKRAIKKVNTAREKGTYTPEVEREFKTVTLGILSIEQKEQWNAILGPRFTPSFAAAKTPEARK